ncbi:tetratricopeptide repeat protein [Candidatus Amoebophilus asiaticus]|nr:tetratricopeptide repeat protein [Candidatus Amoebophilus asiaticus]
MIHPIVGINNNDEFQYIRHVQKCKLYYDPILLAFLFCFISSIICFDLKGNIINKLSNDSLKAAKFFNTAEEHYKSAAYDSALAYYHKCINMYKALNNWEKHVECINHSSWVFIMKADIANAKKYLARSLKTTREKTGNIHFNIAQAYNNYGVLYHQLGEYNMALAYHDSALNLKLQMLDSNDLSVGASYNNIGGIYHMKSDNEKALSFFKKDLTICKKVLGTDHIDLAVCYNNIGVVLQQTGDFERALEYHNKSLRLKLKGIGELHPEIATSYGNLATVYIKQKMFKEALYYYRKALDIRLNFYGTEHLIIATTYSSVGAVLAEMQEIEKAINILNISTEILIRNYGNEHPALATNYLSIGLLCCVNKDFKTALEFGFKALNLEIRKLGKKHPNLGEAYTFIGDFYREQREYGKALAHYQEALLVLVLDFYDNDIYINPQLSRPQYLTKNVQSKMLLLEALKSKAEVLLLRWKEANDD